MAKSLLNMDFHLIFGFSHFKLAFESIIQEELAIINDENIKNYVVESDFRKFYVKFLMNFAESFIIDVRSNPNYLKNPACRQQNRGARGARRNSNFSCISDMLASGAEGPADVIGAHICTGYARCFFSCTLLFTAKFIDPGPNPSTIHRCRAGCSRWT